VTPKGPSKQTRAAFTGLVAFFTSSTVSGVIAAAVSLFAFGQGDPPFAESPEIAFQVAFIGLLFVSAAGTVILAVAGIALGARLGERSSRAICIIGGIAYPVLLTLSGLVFEIVLSRNSVLFVMLGWVMLAGMPLLLALYIARRGRCPSRLLQG